MIKRNTTIYRVIALALVCLVITKNLSAQSFLFSRLNTSQGLSENNARSLTIDKNGFLWIGTSDGLNVYDGYNTTSFYKSRFKQMASNLILHLTTDSKNRVWMGTPEGASWLDINRNFHRVALRDTLLKFYCPSIFETREYGNIVYTNLGQFYYDSSLQKWQEINWIPSSLKKTVFLDAEPFSDNKIIFTMDSLVAVLDYSTRKILYQAPYSRPVTACKMSEQEIAIGLQTGQVLIVNIVTKQIVNQYQLTDQLNGKTIDSYLSEVRKASNGDLLVATDFSGMVIIDKKGNITRHTHDPMNDGSISSNYTYRVLPGAKGEVVVGTYASGANMGNIYNKSAGYNRIFTDEKGNMFDNYINNIAAEGDNVLWFGALDRLIKWDRKTGKSSFYSYYFQTSRGLRPLEIRAVTVDSAGKIFVSVLGVGLASFDKKNGSFNVIKADSTRGPAFRSRYIYDIITASDGSVWMASNGGLYTLDPVTMKVTEYENHPVLKAVTGKRVSTIYEDREGRIWIGTAVAGIYCYNRKDSSLQHYSTQNGMPSDNINSFAQDKAGRIYVSSIGGFSIISNNKVSRSFTRESGLRYEQVQDLMEDSAGNIWIANNKCMIRYNPRDSSMHYFEENSGLSMEGFKIGSSAVTKNGELIWGSRRGINYFYPSELVSIPSKLNLSVHSVSFGDSVLHITSNQNFDIPYANNDISIHYAAINLYGSRNIRYQYRLEGYENEWHSVTDSREAHYTSLPTGYYKFVVRSGTDGIHWTGSNNSVNIHIIPPVWQRWWFVTLCTLLLGGSIFWMLEKRNRMIVSQKEEIETEQAINYFATSMYKQQTVDTILWEVAKNCIGRLQFEDCVIYLIDEERNVLVQKAAYGPKSPKTYEIADPIEIPLGKGIVGSVALSGQPEIIDDTTKDERYIVDDQQRNSEISVPIISDGRVLGIIDCEHSKKGFFTQKHLSILNTIASLCANKIIRTRAEEEKEKAQEILMDTQQKMADVEMQALRAQMNPHFIFNCLNSINRYIVKSDQITASLYLTRFAKLIRLILDNSNSKNVILSNELEALKLYIEMEALRFDKKFTYQITVDDDVAADAMEVPPLIIQPYVENAIWHGLLHKETGGILKIDVSMIGENMIRCVIEDNGIGREKARELKSKSATTKKSLGMKLTENRLTLLNKHAEHTASVEIIDLENKEEPGGTRVILKIPVL